MQNILLIGNITSDAVVRSDTRQGAKSEFVSFTLACNEQRGDERTATFYDVICARTGVLDYLKKGQKVAVNGRFRFAVTQDESGKSHVHLNVSAYNVELCGSAARAGAKAADPGAD